MEFEKLAIEGAWVATSPPHQDNRGFFREWFRSDELMNEVGASFVVAQSNISQSDRGVLRGIHYSLAKAGQAKWITCVTGSIWDVVVDIRPTSPTYRKWVAVELSGDNGKSVVISEGLGHGFISLEDKTLVTYLQTSPYSPSEEFEINPLDPSLAISWPIQILLTTSKDSEAPSLLAREKEGKLPHML